MTLESSEKYLNSVCHKIIFLDGGDTYLAE